MTFALNGPTSLFNSFRDDLLYIVPMSLRILYNFSSDAFLKKSSIVVSISCMLSLKTRGTAFTFIVPIYILYAMTSVKKVS